MLYQPFCSVFWQGGGVIGYERNRQIQINNLEIQVSVLDEKIKTMYDDSPASGFTSRVTENGFDYLAIGNSITLHTIVDYWWTEGGMAASSPELDYYHRVVSGLEERYGSSGDTINSIAYNYYIWETQSHDRAETYDLIDNYLVDGIDLVTVQLSENCSDTSTFESDFRALLEHIKEQCKEECMIVVIDDFWDNDKSRMKRTVCDELGVGFVTLADIRGQEKYMAGMGKAVSGDDGAEHIIEHEGVARHPGDEGMRVIADRVLDVIG